MGIEVKIVGFDRRTERLAVEVDVPSSAAAAVRSLANVPSSDLDLLGSYPLDETQVRQIAGVAHIAIEPGRFDYFLEAIGPYD